MSQNKLLQYGKYLLFIGLMLGALIFLNIAVQNNNRSQVKSDNSKLNVAIVNEDTATTDKNGQVYELGASYVKNLEKDDSNNWTVTSRGAAENGLSKHKYQLMVVIPSNFSEKVLDIDSLTAKQALVSYKVNANGNEQIEERANELGAEIVANLNSQLVNMYMASILGNLYIAQQNVLSLYNMQSANIGSYANLLYQPVVDFQNDFAPLVSIANSSLSANDSLLQSLADSYNSAASEAANRAAARAAVTSSASEMVTASEGISQKTAEVSLSLSNSEFKTALNSLLTAVQNNQNLIDQQESADNGANEVSAYSQLLADLQAQIDVLDGELETIEKNNQAQSELIAQRITEKIRNYYGKESEADDISLKDFLEKEGSQDYINGLETQQKSVQSVINKLPSLDTDTISSDLNELDNESLSFKYQDYAKEYYGTDYSASDLGEQLKTAKDNLKKAAADSVAGKTGQASYSYNNAVSEQAEANDAEENNKADDNAAEADDAAPQTEDSDEADNATPEIENSDQEVQAANVAVRGAEKVQIQAQAYKIVQLADGDEAADTARISISAPDIITVTSITVNNQTISNGSTISLSQGINAISVNYTYKEKPADLDSVQNIAIAVTPNQGSAVTQFIPVDLSPYVNDNYTKAVKDYSALVQRVKDVYETADTVLEASSVELDNKRVPLSTLLNLSLKNYLQNLVTNSLTVAYGDGSDNTSVADIKNTKASLEKNMAALEKNNASLSQEISDLLSAVESMQDNETVSADSDGAETSEANASTAVSDDRADELASLQAEAEAMQNRSAERLSNAQGVNSTFQRFKEQVDRAQANSQALSKTADDLLAEFDDELDQNGNFVDAFSKVFNNAYNNGVANEVLLNFLSNPVRKSSQSVQSRADAYRPFTWILLIEIITLFIAYIFGTENILQRLKDRYRLNKVSQADIATVVLLTVLAIVVGLAMSSFAANQLALGQAVIPSWIFINIVLSLVLVLGQYLLIRYLRILGMGLSLFMLISYIYITSAVGTTASVTGLLAWIKRFNFLSFTETIFSKIVASNILDLGVVFLLLILTAVLIVINIFAPSWREKLVKVG